MDKEYRPTIESGKDKEAGLNAKTDHNVKRDSQAGPENETLRDNPEGTCSITLSANTGISLSMCGTKLWIDALHNTNVGDYSTLDRDMLDAMRETEAFQDPDALIYTHCHEDHFSAELAEKALAEWPEAIAILPEQHLSRQILLEGDSEKFVIGGLEVLMIKVTHEGEEFADVPNYACVISPAGGPAGHACSGHTILILGDSELGNAKLLWQLCKAGFALKCDKGTDPLSRYTGQEELMSGLDTDAQTELQEPARKIDVVIEDFPWAAVRRGRQPIENIICPEHLIIYHLPFEEDDVQGYGPMIRRVISRIHMIPDIRIMDKFLQTEIL